MVKAVGEDGVSASQLQGCGRVEMGATWLHGLQGNPLYAYAVETGIMSPSATQKGKLFCGCATDRLLSGFVCSMAAR